METRGAKDTDLINVIDGGAVGDGGDTLCAVRAHVELGGACLALHESEALV